MRGTGTLFYDSSKSNGNINYDLLPISNLIEITSVMYLLWYLFNVCAYVFYFLFLIGILISTILEHCSIIAYRCCTSVWHYVFLFTAQTSIPILLCYIYAYVYAYVCVYVFIIFPPLMFFYDSVMVLFYFLFY